MANYAHILKYNSSKLHHLCLKSQQIRILDSMLKEYIAHPLNLHFIVANIRDNCVVIEFSSANWATNARFLLPDMLKIVQNKYPDISKIEWYIHPDNVIGKKN